MFNSKKNSLIILGITSIIFSRAWFVFLNDPEGPNLLVVFVMAFVLYIPSLIIYRYNFSFVGFKKFLLVLFVQILMSIVTYFLLS